MPHKAITPQAILYATIGSLLILATIFLPLLKPGLYWPVLHWHLYTSVSAELPSTQSRLQVRVVTESETIIVHSYDLYSNDDISSVQPIGGILLGATANDSETYSAHLAQRLMALVPDAISASLEDCSWSIHYNRLNDPVQLEACNTVFDIDLSEAAT